MLKIPCTLMRVGTSKALFIQKEHLPFEAESRDQILLKLLGTPHEKQIDGLGTGDIIFSKVAIVSKSKHKAADIDFLFAQVMVNEARVNTLANCGNVLSGVAPFAIDIGLIAPQDHATTVNVYNENTGDIVKVMVPTKSGRVCYEGETAIAGVPGKASAIALDFQDSVGKTFGALLPTGNEQDEIDGISVSLVDVGIPVMLLHARDLKKTGQEAKIAFDHDAALFEKLKFLRAKLLAKIGYDAQLAVPKIALLSESRHGAHVRSTYFTPHTCHATHAVTGALNIAAACFIPGTIAAQYYAPKTQTDEIIIEHFAGTIPVKISVSYDPFCVRQATFVRTVRPLLRGQAIIHD